jgi:hypothetical protein
MTTTKPVPGIENTPVCETCGSERMNPLLVTMDGVTHAFDTFECAIERLAPRCRACGRHVIGHGVRGHGAVYCCERCAQAGPPPLAFLET